MKMYKKFYCMKWPAVGEQAYASTMVSQIIYCTNIFQNKLKIYLLLSLNYQKFNELYSYKSLHSDGTDLFRLCIVNTSIQAIRL